MNDNKNCEFENSSELSISNYITTTNTTQENTCTTCTISFNFHILFGLFLLIYLFYWIILNPCVDDIGLIAQFKSWFYGNFPNAVTFIAQSDVIVNKIGECIFN